MDLLKAADLVSAFAAGACLVVALQSVIDRRAGWAVLWTVIFAANLGWALT